MSGYQLRPAALQCWPPFSSSCSSFCSSARFPPGRTAGSGAISPVAGSRSIRCEAAGGLTAARLLSSSAERRYRPRSEGRRDVVVRRDGSRRAPDHPGMAAQPTRTSLGRRSFSNRYGARTVAPRQDSKFSSEILELLVRLAGLLAAGIGVSLGTGRLVSRAVRDAGLRLIRGCDPSVDGLDPLGHMGVIAAKRQRGRLELDPARAHRGRGIGH